MIKNVTQKFIDFNLKISGKIFPEKFNNLLKILIFDKTSKK